MIYRRGPRPAGSLRRSQLLTRAGPGALVDLVEHAIVVGGLDGWRYTAANEGFFSEPRLQENALRMLRAAGHWSDPHVRLRRPPQCDDDEPTPSRGITGVQFPGWFLCQNDRCRSLVSWRALNDRGRHECTEDATRDFPVVPFRFVQACPRGHLMDIYWRRFVHRGEREEGVDENDAAFCHARPGSGRRDDPLGDNWNADLYVIGRGSSGDLMDYIIGCRRCGAIRGLQELVAPNVLGTCKGWRPWLGPHANEPCNETARFLVRTASNAYFPQYISVLSVHDNSLSLRKAVDEYWSWLQKVDKLSTLQTLFQLQDVLERAFRGFDDDDVMMEIRRRQLGEPVHSPPIREAEWAEMMRAPVEVEGELPARNETWHARRADLDLPDFLDRVVLIQALKEVRAQVGFTRLDGFSANAEGEYALDGQRTAPLALQADWIPAVEIRGEGIFIAFDERTIREWEARDQVVERAAQFRLALHDANRNARVPELFTGARLLMLHSLAHLLITQISLECGYGASAIRERIYCYRDDSDDEETAIARSRAGILLYTGTPGSEGTLGGLVEVGRDILRHLRLAAERAMLCSNDPVCAQHDPSGHEEGRHREGAACHSCLLIAEPSCERMNRDLDRALVVPTVHARGADFLGSWLGQAYVAPAPAVARPRADESPSPPPPPSSRTQLERILEQCIDDDVRRLVRSADESGLPLPDFEPVALPVEGDVPAELTWSERKVAVVMAATLTPADVEQARAAGWRVLPMPVAVAKLREALGVSVG